MEVASEAMITRNITNRAVENGKALIDLTQNHGVILHDTPADYFTEYMNAAQATLKKNAAENAFFKEVYEHICLLYTSPSPRDQRGSRMPSSA